MQQRNNEDKGEQKAKVIANPMKSGEATDPLASGELNEVNLMLAKLMKLLRCTSSQ
jgi:hypothetical protein